VSARDIIASSWSLYKTGADTFPPSLLTTKLTECGEKKKKKVYARRYPCDPFFASLELGSRRPECAGRTSTPSFL
ncbi:hypothetical protein PISMIDRAFT_681944, partial [Pisolithus microcarpus 441]